MRQRGAIATVNTGRVDGNAYDDNITLKTTKEQDATIASNAANLQQAYANNDEKYHLITNNCVDAVQDVVQGDKGISTKIELPSDTWTPKPNSYFESLKAAVPFINGDMIFVAPKSNMDNYPAKPIPVASPN